MMPDCLILPVSGSFQFGWLFLKEHSTHNKFILNVEKFRNVLKFLNRMGSLDEDFLVITPASCEEKKQSFLASALAVQVLCAETDLHNFHT